MSNLNELVELVKGHRLFIQTHDYPDPDAIGAAYGLKCLLNNFDIDAKLCYDGSLNKISGIRMLEYLDIEFTNYNDINDMSEDDYIILVDAQKYNKNCVDMRGDEVACIDHHPVFFECEYKYEDIEMVGACSSIIAKYYFDNNIIPDTNAATAMLYGMKMDTNDFGRGVSNLDVEMFYKLYPYADKKILEKMQLNTIEFSDLKAYGAAISNISVSGNIGFACIPFDCADGLIAIISDFLLALDVVEFSVVFSIRESGYKFSIRSEIENLNAGKIVGEALKKLGNGSGGGHSFMAGGFLSINEINKLGSTDHERRQKIEDAFMDVIKNV